MRLRKWTFLAAVSLLMIWLVATVAMFVWAASAAELSASESHAGYFILSGWFAVAAALCLGSARAWPKWGAVCGGLGLTVAGAWAAVTAVGQLVHWGEIWPHDPNSVRTAWEPWDSLVALPFALALPAGLLLLVGGIAVAVESRHDRHRTHGSPHAGATA